VSRIIEDLLAEGLVREIGEGVSQGGRRPTFEKVRKTVNARSLSMISSNVMIRPATFGVKTAVTGAVSLILSEVISLNRDETLSRPKSPPHKKCLIL